MGEIRLLVLDLDGTVVGQSNEILPETLAAIQAAQAQGIAVAIATGRMYQSALRFYRAIASSLPLITYQGAYIKDPTTNHLHQHLGVSRELAEALLDFFEDATLRDRISVHFYIDDQLYVREITEETEAYVGRSTVQPIAVGDLRSLLHQEPTKVLAQSQDIALIDELWKTLKQRYTPTELYLTKSVATFLEATHPKVNKGAAVKYVAEELLGLQPENVMAIGDNLNDLEMLQYAGLGVAMGDAPAAVQTIAQWVAPNVEAGGAAVAIERFLLR
ncbi:MAG: Cof-type HAD-IIB family hydrolase [Cyanobacteria bacterium J06638_22]